jgi:DNA primase
MSDEILQIAHQYLKKVKRSGNEDVMAICPFHRKADGSEERGPSFALSIHSGLWYCHSCHARGNLYTFLRDMGVSRLDLELRYKATIEEAEKYAPKKFDPMNPVEAVIEPLAESFLGLFDQCPQLLLDEGYPEELLRQFDIGFDEKHQRITFPLRDYRGRLVGISGRAVGGALPRYKVYDKEYVDFGLPERKTEKRALLWNVDHVIPRLMHDHLGVEPVVIVEGFKAVMRVAQAGISDVVGLLGSSSNNACWNGCQGRRSSCSTTTTLVAEARPTQAFAWKRVPASSLQPTTPINPVNSHSTQS